MSPLRKGSRCHAPALCLSQWRGWVYATFHLWDKENHCSSCNGGIFRVFREGGFDEINRRWRNFNYSNREVLDLPVGGRNKKENTEVFAVLPSWNDEKEERFLRQKVTVMTWKMVEKIWILSKNTFGESLTKCAPSGHEKTIIDRKSREPFFKYGSLRLNDLSRRKNCEVLNTHSNVHFPRKVPIFKACKNACAKIALQHPIIFGVLASPWTTLMTEKRKFACSWEMKSVPGHLNFLLSLLALVWIVEPGVCQENDTKLHSQLQACMRKKWQLLLCVPHMA